MKIGKIKFKKLHTGRLLAYYKSLRGRINKLSTDEFTMDSFLTSEQIKELNLYADEVKQELNSRPHMHGRNHVTHKTKKSHDKNSTKNY